MRSGLKLFRNSVRVAVALMLLLSLSLTLNSLSTSLKLWSTRFTPYVYLLSPHLDLVAWLAATLIASTLTALLGVERTWLLVASVFTAVTCCLLKLPALTLIPSLLVAAALQSPGQTLSDLLGALAIVEAVNLASYILESLGVSLPLLNAFRPLDQGLFYSLHWLSPLLYPLLAISWLIAIAPPIPLPKLQERLESESGYALARLCLPLALVFAAYIGLIPYLPALNAQGRFVGIDAVRYYDRAKNFSFERWVLRSDRPLTYLLIYAASRLVGAEVAVKALPLACSVALAASSYFFMREYSGSMLAALSAAILAAASPTTTVAMFAGFYSNWISYSASLAALTLALKYRRRVKLLPLAALAATASMLLHPYHWAVLTFSSTLLLAEMVFRRDLDGGLAALSLAAPQLTAFLLMSAIGFNPVAIYANRFIGFLLQVSSNPLLAFSAAMPTEGMRMKWWEAAVFYSYNYAGGGLIDTPLLLLALLGVAALGAVGDAFRRGVLVYWLVPCTVLMLVTPHTRNMYEIPVYVYATLGLLVLQRFVDRISGRPRHAVTTALLLVQACYAVRHAMFTTYILTGG